MLRNPALGFQGARHVPFQVTHMRRPAGRPVGLRCCRGGLRRSPELRYPQRHAGAAAGRPAGRAGDRQFELPDRAKARQSRQRRAIGGAAPELGGLRGDAGDRPVAQRDGPGGAGFLRQDRRPRPRRGGDDLLRRPRRAARRRELSAPGRCEDFFAVRSRRQLAAAGRRDGHAGIDPEPDAHRRARRLPQQPVPGDQRRRTRPRHRRCAARLDRRLLHGAGHGSAGR